jgi:S1-C subfamily serine protease
VTGNGDGERPAGPQTDAAAAESQKDAATAEPPPKDAATAELPPPDAAAAEPPPSKDAAAAVAPAWTDPVAASLPVPEDLAMAAYATAAAASARAALGAAASPDATAPPPPSPASVAESPSAGLDPAAAAFEAARIAEQIVGDISSASGAAIVAAAAAGAAIEAVRARARAMPEGEPPPPPAEAAPGDPMATVRMQRERILRALAEDVAAGASATGLPAQPAEDRAASAPPGAPSQRMPAQTGRASAQLAAETADAEARDAERDPVQIAAAALQRLRTRARTDFAELRGHYRRHDIAVLVIALVLMVVAGRVHRGLVTPPTGLFEMRGLAFEHSRTWLGPEPLAPPPPRIVHDPTGQLPRADAVYNVALTTTLGGDSRIEVLIDKRPAWSNIVTGLELDRRTRWGELYTLDDSSIESIAEHDWLRTAYRYAHAGQKGDVPRIDRAIEYATLDREQLYVVTLFGTAAELEELEEVVAPTLRVPGRNALPLVAQTRLPGQRAYPNAVSRAFDSTVMVVVADLIDGRLRARGGGSGVIAGSDGSILTNYHVIHDKDGRLHDVFIIGRFSMLDRAPQLQCAGRPSRSKLQRELDLALIKCDTDLDGRTWVPATGGVWPALPEATAGDVRMGQRLWVLGYPDAGGGGLTLSQGEIEGFTGQDGAAGKDFIKTDASITHGNSGGPVVDDRGHLVGIASAFRTRTSISGGNVVETTQVGMIRPLPLASDLLAIAAAGWTPREGKTDVELQPTAVEAPAEGVRIATRVLDVANDAPIASALVMVLRPGIDAGGIDVNRLDDQVLAWGRSNTQGDVQLKQPVPVPGTYTVFVKATGYEPLIGAGELRLDANTPPRYDPWGVIHLRAR